MEKSKPIRVISFAPYPSDGPSVRHRISAYSLEWGSMGISLTEKSFMTKHFYKIRRNFGLLNTLLKAIWFGVCSLRLVLRLFLVPFYDVAIIHREAFPLGKPWFELLIIKLAKFSVYDVDDAIWYEPSNEVNQRRFFHDKTRVSKIMSHVYVVVVGNNYLKNYAQSFNQNIFIIPTPYQLPVVQNAFAPSLITNEKPVILWVGNLGNAIYINEVMEALETIGKAHRFTLHLVGGEDIYDIKSLSVDIQYTEWSEAIEVQALNAADIGIMPLVDKGYEQGKCSFKIIQYFSVNLPVVASPIGMNCEILTDGENGFLASDTTEWTSALVQLLKDKDYRQELGKNGHALFLEKYTLQINAKKWRDIFSQYHVVNNKKRHKGK